LVSRLAQHWHWGRLAAIIRDIRGVKICPRLQRRKITFASNQPAASNDAPKPCEDFDAGSLDEEASPPPVFVLSHCDLVAFSPTLPSALASLNWKLLLKQSELEEETDEQHDIVLAR
jgi:hypothetical protein